MDRNEIKLQHINGEPVIRVFLFQGQKHVDFVLKKPFDVYDLDGKKILTDIQSKLRWRIKIKENNVGEEVFRLILWETGLEDEAKKKLKTIRKKIPVRKNQKRQKSYPYLTLKKNNAPIKKRLVSLLNE